MKTAAVICELNPFHNGHAYLMKKLREESGADYIIALMSGNYVQRGEPAVFEKYTRAKMVLSGSSGAYADLVLEMPALFSTASAREFAAAGVRMALLSGVADCIGFGTEGSADTAGLERQAAFLEAAENTSDPSVSALVKAALKAGKTYPEALASAGFSINGSEASVHPDITSTSPEASVNPGTASSSQSAVITAPNSIEAADISAPNNILAAEYLRALKRFDPEHSIKPYSISRVGDGYSSTEAEDPHFCSAGSLRKILLDQVSGSDRRDLFLRDHVPPAALLEYQSFPPLHPDAFSPYLNKALLEAKYRHQDLSVFADVSKEIADRLISRADLLLPFTARISDTKTRQYTYTRISRALLHIALGITKESVRAAKDSGYINYLRILGFRKSAAPLLKALKSNAAVPLVTKTADCRELLGDQLLYDQMYLALMSGKNEFQQSPVIRL